MFENQYINLFMTQLAWSLGARGVQLKMAANLFQQTPLDSALGDLQLGLDDRVYFFEFKSEDTTVAKGGAWQCEYDKGTTGTGIRSHMRARLLQIKTAAGMGNAAAIPLQNSALRGWWFARGERPVGGSPNVDFMSYERTLVPPSTLGWGNILYVNSVQNFIDRMLMPVPNIGMSPPEAADLLDALFSQLPANAKWAPLDELLVVTLPAVGPNGPSGPATWSIDTIQGYFGTTRVPRKGP